MNYIATTKKVEHTFSSVYKHFIILREFHPMRLNHIQLSVHLCHHPNLSHLPFPVFDRRHCVTEGVLWLPQLTLRHRKAMCADLH